MIWRRLCPNWKCYWIQIIESASEFKSSHGTQSVIIAWYPNHRYWLKCPLWKARHQRGKNARKAWAELVSTPSSRFHHAGCLKSASKSLPLPYNVIMNVSLPDVISDDEDYSSFSRAKSRKLVSKLCDNPNYVQNLKRLEWLDRNILSEANFGIHSYWICLGVGTQNITHRPGRRGDEWSRSHHRNLNEQHEFQVASYCPCTRILEGHAKYFVFTNT